MESNVKLGEVQLEMTGDVKTTEDIKVLLRWGWGAETTNKMSFKPSEELKVGDGIKVTIEKVVVVPDPVEEKVEETPVEAEEGQEPVDDKVEAIEKTELEAEGDTAEEGEKVVVETEKTDEASDETKTA
ncbi:MAG TPA: hypothetical protein DCR71_02030 [Dehalococcoidia bacterium]|nr:hypothetical protein [Dehalococcoidia bacterium]